MKKLIIWLLLLISSFTADAQLIGGGPRKPKGGSTVDLSGYAVKAANNLFSGNNTFSSVLTTASISPDGHNTRALGASSANWNIIWGQQILSSVIGNATFGTSVLSNNIAFRQGGTNTTVGGFFGTTGNAFNQAAGVFPADNGYRFQNYGTSYLGGDVSVIGNITPDGNGVRDLGSSSNRWNIVWAANVLSNTSATMSMGSTNAASNIVFRQGNGSQVVGGYFSTTGEHYVQSPGVVPTNNGYRFQNYGTSYLGGDVQVAGNLAPDANITRDIGAPNLRYANIYTTNLLSNNSALSISTGSTAPIYFRQAPTGSGVYSGFYGTTSNFFLQAPGSVVADNGYRFQLTGSQRMTGDMVHSSTSNVYNYNTVDESTNYERVRMGWSSNVFQIYSEAGGTGASTRNFQIGNANAYFGIAGGVLPFSYRDITGNAQALFGIRGTMSNASGQGYGLAVTPTINQTGSGNFSAFVVSPFYQSLAGATRILADFGSNSAPNLSGTHTSVANINSVGDGFFAGGLTVGGSISSGGADLANSIGSSSARYNSAYIQGILMGSVNRAFSIAQTGATTNTIFRVQPTTGNVVIQAPGAVPTDRGFTLDVLGTMAVTGPFTLNDGTLTKNTAGSWNFGSAAVAGITNLSSSNLVLGASLAAGTSGVFGRTATFAVPSAALEVESTTKGFLPPRMTEANKNAIASPAEGLMIFQNSGSKGWYGYDGSAWVKLNP